MPRDIVSRGDRHEIQNALLTGLSLNVIAAIYKRTPNCISQIAVRWYAANDCKNREELMAQEIKRLKEQLIGPKKD